jgi:hypothetical protein
MSAKRALLLGMLALRNNFTSRPRLLAGFGAWAIDRSQSLATVLLQQQAFSADQRALLDAIVVEHLRKHNDDLDKSLAALGVGVAVHDDLAKLRDHKLRAAHSQRLD